MDDPALPEDRHRAALRGLRRIHRWTGTAGRLWPDVHTLSREGRLPVRVLDVGCGDGAVADGLARRAARDGVELVVEGVDLSPRAGALAAGSAIRRVHVVDAVRGPLPGGFDLAVSTLFLHHLSAEDAAAVLKRMAASTRSGRVAVSDLARGRLAWCWAWLGCRLLSRSRVVHRDGPQSVRAGWTADELRGLAEAAGLRSVRVRERWPFRLELRAG